MKSFLPALLAFAGLAATAAPPPLEKADLRQVLTQVQRTPAATALRKLSPEQRAELRRQLKEARQQRRRP